MAYTRCSFSVRRLRRLQLLVLRQSETYLHGCRQLATETCLCRFSGKHHIARCDLNETDTRAFKRAHLKPKFFCFTIAGAGPKKGQKVKRIDCGVNPGRRQLVHVLIQTSLLCDSKKLQLRPACTLLCSCYHRSHTDLTSFAVVHLVRRALCSCADDQVMFGSITHTGTQSLV